MTAVGGSVESITIMGREFPMAADADINRKLGGFENESQANGDGSARLIKTRVPPMLSGIVVECDNDRGDQEFLQAVANNNEYVATVISYADGNAYQGRHQIVGELQYSNQAGTASFDMAGTGVMTKQ